MKIRPIFPFSSCRSYLRWKDTYTNLFKLDHLGLSLIVAIMSIPNPAQAFPLQQPPPNCLKDTFDSVHIPPPPVPPLNCVANDVSIAQFKVLSPIGHTTCVVGQTINVQLTAVTQSTAQAFLGAPQNGRFDVGYWIALDGGNATTGHCFDDFLPPPLVTSSSSNPITSPFLDLNGNACGDVIKTVATERNIGEGFSPPEPPATLSIPCLDKDKDGFADLSACTSWSNNFMNSCSSQIDTLPETGSKCNCDIVNMDNIAIQECDPTHPCPIGNLCQPIECDDGKCVQRPPVVCPPPTDICHTQGTCNPATGLCTNPPLVCDTPPECQQCIFPPPGPGLCGECVLNPTPPQIAGCNYQNVPNGPPPTTCDGANHECVDGMCVPISQCTAPDASNCPPVECATASCPAGTCVYTPDTSTTCGADDICSNGKCVECIVAANCPGSSTNPVSPNPCNIATCDANQKCQYAPLDCNSFDFGDGSEIKCTIDCCDPTMGGCVHTPSNDECMILDDACNVGICGITGNCESEALAGDPCGDPSSCTEGICVLGANDRATCEITFTCTPPDTCSTASCDGAGICTISSSCICPDFCDNAIPIGSCVENENGHCGRNEGGDGNFFGGGGLVSLPPVPVPVPVPVPAPAVAPVPGVVSPVNNIPNGYRPDQAPPVRDSLSGEIKGAPLGSNDKDSKNSSSCATTGTDIKDLWMWMVIFAAVYLISVRKRAQAKSTS